MLTVNTNLREHLLQASLEEELRRIIYHIAGSAKYIGNMMGESNRKLTGALNLTTDQLMEIDVLANQILIERLRRDTSFGINEFASEELNRIIRLDTNSGSYSITADPLDGSEMADVNLAIGTLIGIYKGPILQNKPGHENLVAAMSILYGPLTTLTYAAGKGTHEFVLNPTGDFILANENIRMKEKGSIYSPGGFKKDWFPKHKKYIDALEADGHKLRYSGGLVADINQILLKRGGLFTYPALKGAEDGKLRLVLELNTIAYLIEQAGGKATDGTKNILDLVPKNIDERSPAYIGSQSEVDLATEFLK